MSWGFVIYFAMINNLCYYLSMTKIDNRNIDPELVDDREVEEVPLIEVDLPDFDASQFELDDDFEFTEEDDEDDS